MSSNRQIWSQKLKKQKQKIRKWSENSKFSDHLLSNHCAPERIWVFLILLATDSSGVWISLRIPYLIRWNLRWIGNSEILSYDPWLRSAALLRSAVFYKSGDISFHPIVYRSMSTTRGTLRPSLLPNNPFFKYFVYNCSWTFHKRGGFTNISSILPSSYNHPIFEISQTILFLHLLTIIYTTVSGTKHSFFKLT